MVDKAPGALSPSVVPMVPSDHDPEVEMVPEPTVATGHRQGQYLVPEGIEPGKLLLGIGIQPVATTDDDMPVGGRQGEQMCPIPVPGLEDSQPRR